MSDALASISRTWNDLSTTKRERERQSPREWDWITAVPKGGKRAEVVPPIVGRNVVAAILPGFRENRMLLASTGRRQSGYRIAEIDGESIANVDQLQTHVDDALQSGQEVELAFVSEGSNDRFPQRAMVSPQSLLRFAHFAAAHEPLLRVTSRGASRVLIRDGNTRCQINAKVERNVGLLVLEMSLQLCGGTETLLPVEVNVRCSDAQLTCLTVADTLELLHGGLVQSKDTPEDWQYSFAAVSELEQYLVPANFKRLQHALQETDADLGRPRLQPALASIPGKLYPGSAVLGDARALTGFLLQRHLVRPGDPPIEGWIMFAGFSLSTATSVDVTLDLGNGPKQIQLALPS